MSWDDPRAQRATLIAYVALTLEPFAVAAATADGFWTSPVMLAASALVIVVTVAVVRRRPWAWRLSAAWMALIVASQLWDPVALPLFALSVLDLALLVSPAMRAFVFAQRPATKTSRA